jgi:hypothetical protein
VILRDVDKTTAWDDLRQRGSIPRRRLLRPGGAGVRAARPGALGARPEQVRAGYQLPDGTRAVVAQRIDRRVAISDVPLTDDTGCVYLIERHVGNQVKLAGLVAAYVEHSQQAGCPAVIAQRRQLDELVDTVA